MYDHILTLADALKEYYSEDEINRMTSYYKIEVGTNVHTGRPDYSGLAELLLDQPGLGRNRDFLAVVKSSLMSRFDEAIATTDWEVRESHRSMGPRIHRLLEMLRGEDDSTEVTVKAKLPFSAKAEIRELIESATTPIIVVDNYVGLGTLDCLLGTSQPIRLLCGAHKTSIEKDFDRHLSEYRSETRLIEVRRHGELHDRYIILNRRCWILGSSIKDAGKKMFSMIELTDSAGLIIEDVEMKWQTAEPYDP